MAVIGVFSSGQRRGLLQSLQRRDRSASVNLSDSTAFHAERPQLSDRSRRLRLFFEGACRWLGINLSLLLWRCCDASGGAALYKTS
jgi:hypothetical protein